MLPSTFNKIAKVLVLSSVIAVLYACGGTSSDSSSNSSSSVLSAKPSSELLSLQNNPIITTSSEGRTDGEVTVAASAEQLKREEESLAKFTKLMHEQADVKGFIVKYKDSVTSIPAKQVALGATATATANTNETATALSGALLQTKVNQLNKVTTKYGFNLQPYSNTVSNATVLTSNVGLTQNKAKQLAAEILSQDPSIEYIEPDLTLKLNSSLPTSIELTDLWALKNSSAYGIKAETAWSKATGAGIVVAVLDTGYLPHEDLNSQYVKNGAAVAGYDFISNNSYANDANPGRDPDASDPGDACKGEPSSWHGTHVAGIIAAANNGDGVVGLAYNAKILPVRVLGKCGGLLSDVAAAIVWASGGTVKGVPVNPNPAKVINLSLGAASSTCSTTMSNAIKIANSKGAVVVVAAGNDSMNVKYATPANCANAVTVAATNERGDLTWWSNYGVGVDVSAPGEGIYSTYNDGSTTPALDNYQFLSGTSMAAPYVAALYAMIFELNNTSTLKEVDLILKMTTGHFSSDQGFVDSGGSGIIDTTNTLNSLTRQKIWKTKGDYDGNGISDLLWRNLQNGSTKISNVSANALDTNEIFLLPDAVPYTDPMFRIEISADFNGDKNSDILWRNVGTGKTTTSTMVGRWATGHNDFGINNAPYIDRTYVAIGSGDINNDGYSDILWRNSSGIAFISFMYSSFEVSRTDYFNISSALKNIGSGDFNGDGYNDYIWKNKAGVISVLYLAPRIGLFETIATPPKNYSAIAVGDYNGDKEPDILLKHATTGALAIMLDASSPNRKIIYAAANRIVVPKNHSILAPGDYDGDGKDDVMTRNNSTGEITRFNVAMSTNSAIWTKTLLAGKVPTSLVNKY